MKITVINGTEKHGVTWRLKEIFLERFREKAEITEFYLPEDCPCFCMGCAGCIFKGEHICKDFSYIRKIAEPLLESDLIVMTSPAYLWMPHRPAPEMFSKRAVIITQCLGAGARSAAADIKHSLSWWGISQITVFTGKLMSDIVWEKLAGKKRAELTGRMNRLSKKLAAEDFGQTPGVSAVTKIKFLFCRMMQKSLHENDPEYTDGKYWAQQGWLSGKRPW